MIYNKLIKEYEIEYYNIHIPCLYDVDVKCIHKCKLYWSFLTGAINNKKITMQKREQKIMEHEIKYPDICYRIDNYWCDERFCHYWHCTHHYFPEGNKQEYWDKSKKLLSR